MNLAPEALAHELVARRRWEAEQVRRGSASARPQGRGSARRYRGRAMNGVTSTFTCAVCGAHVSRLPLTWSVSTAGQGLRYACAPCSRRELRDVEGRLDPRG